MKKLKYILILMIFLAAGSTALAGKVVVRLKKPPPMQFHVENMWSVTLINSGPETYRVYLRGTANLQSEGIIANAHTGAFTLGVGTKVVNASEINPIHLDEVVSKYEAPVKHLGAVPNGSYEICVSVINADDGTVLAEECYNTEVMNVTELNLLSPDDGALFAGNDIEFPKDTAKTKGKTSKEITLNQQQTSSNVIFSWMPPSPVNAAVHFTYMLKIVQQLGSQSGYDAMQSNPMYYSAGNLNTTIYQYPIAARHFTSGKYAWQVEAYLDGVLVSSSEVREFRFGTEKKSTSQAIRQAWFRKQWALKDGTGLNSASGTSLGSKPFLFSFESKIYGESSNRSGTGSDKKPQYGYTELTPSVSLFGFPFASSILLSSENSENRQNINSAGLNLDASVVKDYISEKIDKEKEKMLQEGNKDYSSMSDNAKDKIDNDAKSKVMSRLSPALKFISYFRQMGFGTTYPDYSPLTVRGVPLTGVNLEFNPGWFYIALGGFKNQKPIDNNSYRRDVYTGRIGVGQRDGSHVYFTGLYAKDNESSIKLDSANNILTPKANYVFGIEGKLNLFRKKISLEGEISGAMLTRDTRSADLDNASIPQFVKNLIHPKISSSVDFAYTLKGTYFNDKSKTKFSAGLKMIGPGYTSLGVPTLATDKLEVVSKAEQKLVNNKVSLTASFLWSRDNLIDWKRYTTSYTMFTLTANITPKDLPYIIISYNPSFQKNNAADVLEKIDNKTHMLFFAAGKYFRKWNVNFNSSINYYMNISDSPDSLSRSSSHNIQLSETFGFSFPLTISASAGFSFARLQGIPDRIISADFSGSYVFEDFITLMGGFSTAYERDLNKKNSEYIGVSSGYMQYFNIELRAEKNIYHEWLSASRDYDEFLLKGIVSLKF